MRRIGWLPDIKWRLMSSSGSRRRTSDLSRQASDLGLQISCLGARTGASPSLCFPGAETELVLLHVYPAAPERDAFLFQPQTLFDGRISTQFDLAISAYNPLPRQAIGTTQGRYDLAGGPRRTSRVRDCSVSGYFSARDLPNGSNDSLPQARIRLGFLH